MSIESNHSAIRRMRMRGDHFTQVSNDLARDQRLSRRARGLFVELASHREGWQTSIAKLAESGPEGIHAIRVAISELEKYGYLVRAQIRDPKTKQVVGTEYWITDCPEVQTLSSEPSSGNCTTAPQSDPPRSEPVSENPSSAELISAEPTSEDRTPYKKTIPQNTNEEKTSKKTPGSFADAQEPAGQPATQETLDGIPAPAAPPQLTVLPGGEEPELSVDQQARTIADRYWAWLKEQGVPAPAANDRGRGTPYVKFVSMVRGRLKNGWTPVEIENALIDLFDNRNKVFPPAGVLDEKLVERRRGRASGKQRRDMYRDEQWDDPALRAEVEEWNQQSHYGRTRPSVQAMTDEELQAAWDELGAPRREATR